MSILITGAAGFIGFALAREAVKRDIKVYLVDNFARGAKDDDLLSLCTSDNACLLEGDLLDPQFCAQLPFNEVKTFYHFAAINGTQNFYERPYEVIKANFSTLTNVLDAIPLNSNLNFVYSSSSEAYAGSVELDIAPIPTPEAVPLTILDPLNSRWSYGASKLLAEIALNSFAKNKSIRPFIVRFHNIYGPRMGFKHVIPNFVEKIINILESGSTTCEIMGAQQTRSFCYIQDAVRALMTFSRLDIEPGIYNIGDPREEISIQNLYKKCEKILSPDLSTDVISIPPLLGDVSRREPDITKLTSLGFAPQNSLDDGLKLTISWYRNYFDSIS